MQQFKAEDKIIVVSGQLKGATGRIEKESVILPGGYICRLDSLKPIQIKTLGTNQIKLSDSESK